MTVFKDLSPHARDRRLKRLAAFVVIAVLFLPFCIALFPVYVGISNGIKQFNTSDWKKVNGKIIKKTRFGRTYAYKINKRPYLADRIIYVDTNYLDYDEWASLANGIPDSGPVDVYVNPNNLKESVLIKGHHRLSFAGTLFVLVPIGLLLFAGIAYAMGYIYEKKRSGTLQLAAQSLGLFFEQKGRINIEQHFGQFHLFSVGSGKKIKYRMYGTIDEVDVMVFRYEYTVLGAGDAPSTTYKQTVASFRSNKMNLPGFELRPERLFHKIGGIFGYQDIDFDTHPKFSRYYLLRSSNEPKIRSIFSSKVLSFFEKHKGLCVEAQGNTLLCYRREKKVKPHKIKLFFEEGYNILRLFYSG